MRVYIINGNVSTKNLDYRSHRGYLIVYASTIEVIIYWKPDHTFVIHRSQCVWFDEYNSSLSIEDKQNQGSLLIQQDPESIIHISDLLNLIPCGIDLTSTIFSNTTIITFEIELPHSGKKVGFILLDDGDFTIHCINDTIPNLPSGNPFPTHTKLNVWIIAINGEEPITAQGVLDEINHHQSTHGKSKVKISLFRRKIYQRTDFEEIHSRFDQIRPVVSHIKVFLP